MAKEFFNTLQNLKESVTSMSNQCLDIQRELATILTTIGSAKEEENSKKVDTAQADIDQRAEEKKQEEAKAMLSPDEMI